MTLISIVFYLTVDADITHAMDEELSYQSVEDFAGIEVPIRESLSKHQFELQDKEGAEEVLLTKQTDKEEIKVVFSVSSILDESADLDDVITTADDDKKTDETNTNGASALSLALRVAITKVSKKDKGTMAFDLIAKEDEVSLINIEYNQDRSFLLPESAYQSRRGSRRYLGPNCLALDVSLQQSFQSYLSNTGINQDVIKLIVDYAQYKRRKEYAAWLKNLGNFTDN
ncbi:hypothetical protein INT43_004809 [Umbelopsis isabellina]|uniref:Uncharacterized protein n=1 Tax=Mortierella isabellina TaxID=91625 RepID=A0A8H7U9Z6_MORIS|nr:hypothetical protein INT43_004809 [Umbelopsis isabellina]